MPASTSSNACTAWASRSTRRSSGRSKLNRPCRIYAPVGTHETLLAYLVRRLLENGANTSFVNQIADPEVTLDMLLADPVERARALQPVGAPHPRIALPRDLFGGARKNSRGLDLANEQVLASLAATLQAGGGACGRAGAGRRAARGRRARRDQSRRPSRRRRHGDRGDAGAGRFRLRARPAMAGAAAGARGDPAQGRRSDGGAADAAVGPIVREAGKTFGNAVGEVREAVDFLRYYAGCVDGFSNDTHRPLGLVACISPWNFPLSIFTGQIAGALAAGNAVIAKPAEETPLIAAQAVAFLHEAGVPRAALQFLPGDGEVGGRLVGNPAVAGVVFTGSTEVARSINRQLAQRLCAGRQAADPDRRDRRPERAGGRFLGAARAAGARRPDLGLRFGRPALLGAARALPAGRYRRSRDAHAGRRDGRARASAIRIACRSMSGR